MSLEPRAYWIVRCDRCRTDAFEMDEITAYPDPKSALEELRHSNWLITEDGKHFCEDCGDRSWSWEDR